MSRESLDHILVYKVFLLLDGWGGALGEYQFIFTCWIMNLFLRSGVFKMKHDAHGLLPND